jgi:membrane protease YdiL (CAAX protease family)
MGGLAVAYVVATYAADTLALHGVDFGIDWTALRWRTAGAFDVFKFLVWFVCPFLLCLPWMDWSWWSPASWRRADVAILVALAVLGMAAVAVTRLVPALHALYPSLAEAPADIKWAVAQQRLLWTASWLVGWEFLHRYVLLRALAPGEAGDHVPWGAVASVAALEAAYHVVQKPAAWLEAVGMLVFGAVLTLWAARRRNFLLPLVAHAIVEVELLLFQLFA